MNWAVFNFGIVVAGCIAAIIGVRRGPALLDRRRARRALRGVPPYDERAIEGRPVRVTGVVRILERTLTAPLSGRECVVARARIRGSNSAFGDFSAPYETMAFVRFELVRGNERIVVDGKYAELDLAATEGSFEKSRKAALLAEHHLSEGTRTWYRFEEVVVANGDRVSISGLLMKDAAVAPSSEERGFRDSVAPLVRLGGNLANPIVIGAPID